MMKFTFEDIFNGYFSSTAYSKTLEESLKAKLVNTKCTTNTYKEKDSTITEKIYQGEGFEYTTRTVEYNPSKTDMELYRLQGELEKAVYDENYIDAANIKTEIDKLKKQTKNDTK